MNKQHGMFLMSLCLAGGPMVACDDLDDASASLRPGEAPAMFESIDLRVGVGPRVERSDDSASTFVGEIASLGLDTLAVPAPSGAAESKHFPTKTIEPTDELVIDWMRWALAQSAAESPVTDTTGERCGLGQEGPVWFLAGTFGGPVVRECDIPAGKQLFFPLVNRWCVFPPEFFPDGDGIDDVLPEVDAWYDEQAQATCSLTLRIDGEEVRSDLESLDDELYIRVLEPFEIDMHEDWTPDWFAGGEMPATGDGHYARIQPLTPGDHVIELGGSMCGQYPFETLATYILHVGPPQS